MLVRGLHRSLLGALVLVAMPATGTAQARYVLAADTLRYREITDAELVIAAPQGAMTVRTQSSALIALRAAGPDSAVGWFEALRLRQEAAGKVLAPATQSVLRRPFALRLTARGEVTTRKAPVTPKEILAIGELDRLFDDFLITLPVEPLRVGVSWADTLVQSLKLPAGRTHRERRIRRYRVDRDTTVGGEPAVIIAVTQSGALDQRGPVDGQPNAVMGAAMQGTDEGEAVFAPEKGRLLSRTRSGQYAGEFTVSGGPVPVNWPQRLSYTTTLVLEP